MVERKTEEKKEEPVVQIVEEEINLSLLNKKLNYIIGVLESLKK